MNRSNVSPALTSLTSLPLGQAGSHNDTHSLSETPVHHLLMMAPRTKRPMLAGPPQEHNYTTCDRLPSRVTDRLLASFRRRHVQHAQVRQPAVLSVDAGNVSSLGVLLVRGRPRVWCLCELTLTQGGGAESCCHCCYTSEL